jgi:hypothetical protein
MSNQVGKLVARFVEAAQEKGSEGGPRDHELYDELREILNSLKGLGSQGKDAFRSLLHHDSPMSGAW